MNDSADSQALYAPLFFFASAGWLVYNGQEIGTLSAAAFLLFGMIAAAVVVGVPARLIGSLLSNVFSGTSANGAKRAALLITPPLLLAQAVASFEAADFAYKLLFA